MTIEVDCSQQVVTITNRSEQQVRRPHIESISGPRPPVRWGDRVHELNEDGEEYEVGDRDGDSDDGEEYVQVLQPHMSTGGVQYQYFDAQGQTVSTSTFFNERNVRVDDVTITFDISGVRWRRTGNREPVRVAQPAPTQPLRAQVRPFIAHWISRIRRHVHRW